MSDFYQLTNSTTDFKSRLSDVFDKLANLEKEHGSNTNTLTPVLLPDDETPSTSIQNPTIPSNAITFKKRPADDSFTRPMDKWKKYDLDGVNEHHLNNVGNQHALNDFLRTRVKPTTTKETEEDEEEEVQSTPVFRRPAKKHILTNEADDEDDHKFISIRAPLPANPIESKTETDNDDETSQYKLKSIRRKPRGVSSTNEKKASKSSLAHSEGKDANDDDDEEEDIDDELFEP